MPTYLTSSIKVATACGQEESGPFHQDNVHERNLAKREAEGFLIHHICEI